MRRLLSFASICVISQLSMGQVADPAAPAADPATPPAAAPASTGQPVRSSGGRSLLKASIATQADPGRAKLSDVSFYVVPEAEPKTLKKHDLLTIIVREESQFSSKGKNEFTKESSYEAKLEEWIQLKPSNWEIEGGALGAQTPSIKASGTRDFNGEGKVDRTDKFTARIQAEVVDVKPNGTVVLQARKKIKTDNEEQQFTLSGICRVEDVTADNSVLSTQLFDLELEKISKGDVREASRRSWLSKLLDVVNPF